MGNAITLILAIVVLVLVNEWNMVALVWVKGIDVFSTHE